MASKARKAFLTTASITLLASMAGAQVTPPLVPMENTGKRPSNRKGIRDRIEWQS